MRGSVRRGIALAVVAAAAGCGRESAPPAPPPAPNVVLFAGDGLGVGAWSLGREVARGRGESLVLDDAPHAGFLETRAADALVTDTAAAATAWATGEPAGRSAIGSRAAPPRPGLFARLRAADRAYGLVTTLRVTGGVVAPFYVRDEGGSGKVDEEDAARQLLAAMPTVVIGAGRERFLPAGAGGNRRDGRNLLEEATAAGVAVAEKPDGPLPPGRPVLALLAGPTYPHETDRRDEPDLADLVLAAIDRLAAEKKPYFLVVEEGRIDAACRDHDAASVARNVERLDRAVRAALGRVDPARTLVVVAADHATDSPALNENAYPESLDVVSMSVERMERRIFGGKPWRGTPRALEAHALPVLDEGARQTGLEAGDLDRLLLAADRDERATALGHAISRRFGVSFLPYRDHLASTTVHGSTAEPVPVRAWGVRAAEVAGVRDHARFGRWLADVMDLPEPAPSAAAADDAADDAAGAEHAADSAATPPGGAGN